jgi:ATPase family AAA domain-containing protein 3A/B
VWFRSLWLVVAKMYYPSSGSSKKADDSKKDGKEDSITGKFDPTALERGAKALKELDESPNATKAFELTKIAEVTKQKELQKEVEQMQTQRAEAAVHRAQAEGEEKRKTVQYQADQERRTAEYKAKLDSELYQNKLEDQQKQTEAQLQMQHEQFLRQEEVRKKNDMELEQVKLRTMQEQAKLDRETQIARAQAEAKGRTEQERENVEVRLREMRARLSEERKTRLESIQEIFGGLGAGSKALLEDRTKLTALVGGLTALALGVYSARAATRVGGNLIERQLMRPPLVRETSRFTWSANAGQWRWPWSKQDGKIMEKIVLEDELAERLEWTTNSLVNAKRNGTPFRHLILHGPPGTGKTLFARTLSRQSGLDYAIMSGGDVGPLGKDAVHEVNKLFTWANSSRKGLILFIDEADAFLRTGRGSESGGMSEEARNVLSAFLHHTGTESDKFVVVLATNIRGVLDRAVLDRIDESFEFPLPSAKERQRMLEMFMDQYIHTPTKKGRQIEVDEAIDEEWITKVAERTDGFSGRQLSKLVVAYQAAVFGSGTTRLTTGLAETVLQYKLAHREDANIDISMGLSKMVLLCPLKVRRHD